MGATGERDDMPACAKCVSYFITHDARFPYGCRAMGFKSETLPLRQVLAATGAPCQFFQVRQRRE